MAEHRPNDRSLHHDKIEWNDRPVVRVEGTVMSPNELGWLPHLGPGPSKIAIYESTVRTAYLLYAYRIKDKQVTLNTRIPPHMQFIKASEVFQRWMIGDQRMGLAFNGAPDARSFDRGIRVALENLEKASLMSSSSSTSSGCSRLSDEPVSNSPTSMNSFTLAPGGSPLTPPHDDSHAPSSRRSTSSYHSASSTTPRQPLPPPVTSSNTSATMFPFRATPQRRHSSSLPGRAQRSISTSSQPIGHVCKSVPDPASKASLRHLDRLAGHHVSNVISRRGLQRSPRGDTRTLRCSDLNVSGHAEAVATGDDLVAMPVEATRTPGGGSDVITPPHHSNDVVVTEPKFTFEKAEESECLNRDHSKKLELPPKVHRGHNSTRSHRRRRRHDPGIHHDNRHRSTHDRLSSTYHDRSSSHRTKTPNLDYLERHRDQQPTKYNSYVQIASSPTSEASVTRSPQYHTYRYSPQSEMLQLSSLGALKDPHSKSPLYNSSSYTESPGLSSLKAGEKKNGKYKEDLGERLRCRYCQAMFNHDRNVPGSCPDAPRDSCHRCVDCVSCMKCADLVLYHCLSDSEGNYDDDPCSCSRRRTEGSLRRRWLVLGLLSIFVPCLCLYPILKSFHRCGVQCNVCGGRHEGVVHARNSPKHRGHKRR